MRINTNYSTVDKWMVGWTVFFVFFSFLSDTLSMQQQHNHA